MPRLRVLQTFTAAAALFAVIGGCGLVPAGPARPVRRPRPPGRVVTIRSLTGTWEATMNTPDGRLRVTLSVIQSADVLTAHLTCGERTWQSRPAPAARIDRTGAFTLAFGASAEILIRGRADRSGSAMSAWVEGLGSRPALVDFSRR